MQMIINVILSAILVVWFLLAGAIGLVLPDWINWVLGVAAALALVLSFFIRPGTIRSDTTTIRSDTKV